jgi:nucleoside-diphosphate-sugar epimerase
MKIALTGAAGFVGSHVLSELHEHGYEVTALVRNDGEAEAVAAGGATPALVDPYDRPALAALFASADGSVHTAGPGDETGAELDSAVVDSAIEAFVYTGKPHIQIGCLWVYGANPAISETSPFNAPAMVAWKERIDRRLLAQTDIRGVVIASSVAYGDGGGALPRLLLGSPQDNGGNLIMLGDGQQHWSTVHVADLAEVFRLVLEDERARGHYVVGNGQNPTVAELTEAAAVAAGAPGAVPGSGEEAKTRVGEDFAEVLLLDQATHAARARAELDWFPSRPGFAHELRHGSYRGAHVAASV